ncbi:hypothetical protein ACFX2B_023376 [Malus domestica]
MSISSKPLKRRPSRPKLQLVVPLPPSPIRHPQQLASSSAHKPPKAQAPFLDLHLSVPATSRPNHSFDHFTAFIRIKLWLSIAVSSRGF